MTIIAFSGKKQSGKTTAAKYIQEQIGDAVIVSFGDTIKDIVRVCLGGPKDMSTDKAKNTMLPCGKTVREALQIVGTDWFRSLDENTWVTAWKYVASKYYHTTTIIAPDVRFPTELKYVQEEGGHVIRLLRAPFAEEDQHESETALDSTEEITMYNQSSAFEQIEGHIRFDAIIDNRKMTIKQKNEAVWKLITEKKWL